MFFFLFVFTFIFQTLLNTVKNLVNHDLHQQVATLTQTVKRAIVPQSDVCCICEQLLYDEDPKFSLICFRSVSYQI